MSTTARNAPEPYTGPDTSAQLIALQQLEHIAALQREPSGRAALFDLRPEAGTQAPQAPWSDAEAYAPVLAPERKPARHGRDDLRRLLDRWQRLPLLGRLPFPLAAALLVQAALSLRLVWSNTAFADEALYLWAGHMEWDHWLHGLSLAHDAMPTYFSGVPAIYPPLGALADSLGGLAAARVLSLLFMLGATCLLYATTRRLFSPKSAAFAVALFACTGPTQFLGALATYDAMALFLLALATWTAVRATACRSVTRVTLLMLLAGAAVALADAAKYASTLFDPVVFGVAALALWRPWGLRRAVAAAGAMLAATVVLAAAGVWAGGRPLWTGITTTTLTRVSGATPIPEVLFDSGKWIGPVAFLAMCGALGTVWSRGLQHRLLAALLTLAVFLAPVEQARIHTLTSLFKHVDYGGWFACIVAGYALSAFARAVPAVKAAAADRVGAVTVALAGVAGFALAGAHFAGWPNTTQMITQIAPVIARTQCPCMATQSNAIDYYLHETSYSGQLKNAFSFRYWDWRIHREVGGAPAIVAAIEAHYLTVVEIDPSQDPAAYLPVTHILEITPGYTLVGKSPSGNPHEPAEVWVLGR